LLPLVEAVALVGIAVEAELVDSVLAQVYL
jgi:hypothetical protein